MPSSTAVLDLLALIYGAVVRARNALYDHGLLRAHRVPPVVVSIGNIEAGGTGKTPFAMALAGRLHDSGISACILTRGYRGALGGPLLVQPGNSCAEVGDEALLMARIQGVPVIKSPDRLKGALFAFARLGSEVVVLDDGFQHRRLHRDLDIVLVSRDVSRERLLPAGPLREHTSGLSRAHYVVAMKGAPYPGLSASLTPRGLSGLDGEHRGLEALSGARVLAFCAIGRPSPFFSQLEGLGATVDRLSFPDHHRYTVSDAAEIMDRASGHDLVVCTEKDMVKLEAAWFTGLQERLFALTVDLDMPAMEDIIDDIRRLVQARRVPGQG